MADHGVTFSSILILCGVLENLTILNLSLIVPLNLSPTIAEPSLTGNRGIPFSHL